MSSGIKLGIYLALIVLIVQVYGSVKEKEWYEHAEIYQIYPRSFKDSDGDGVGDLPGITSKLEHLVDIGVNTIWLSPMFQSPQVDFGYDVSDFKKVDEGYGTMEDFDDMMTEIKRLGLRILLDFVPNHSSDQHEWFVKSVNEEPGFKDLYVWHDGKVNPAGGRNLPPNNWISVFGGSAWEWNYNRDQYYLHQFTPQQPDLNYRNEKVKEEMVSVLEFWLAKGIDGFRFDAINHMFETEGFPDEPLSGSDKIDTYDYLDHRYTKDVPEVYDIVASWREVIDNYTKTNGGDTRIIMTEAYTSIERTMNYYQSEDGETQVAHMPFNFYLIYDIKNDSNAYSPRNAVNTWLDHMPSHKTPNWVLGSHDHSRAGSRIGEKQIDMLNALVLTLPGTSITYYGDEIGMLDYMDFDIKDNRDPNRTPMQWDKTTSAGFSSNATTWLPVNPNYNTLNVAAQNDKALTHLEIYKTLTNFRNLRTMTDGEYIPKIITNNIFAFTRELLGSDTFIMIFNFAEEETIVDVSGFVNIHDDLTVEVISGKSKYTRNKAVKANAVQIGALDFLILRSINESDDSNATSVKVSLSLIIASSPENRLAKDDSSVIDRTNLSGIQTIGSANQSTSDTQNSRNGQIPKQGALTIVRRSSKKNNHPNQTNQESPNQIDSGDLGQLEPYDTADDRELLADEFEIMQSSGIQNISGDELDSIDLATDNLPAVDTPDACDKAALRLRCLLRQLQRGEISAELLQKNLHYAARVLEAVFIDETNNDGNRERISCSSEQNESRKGSQKAPQTHSGPTGPPGRGAVQRRRLRTPVWARLMQGKQRRSKPTTVNRRLADEDDELSEVQPDAVPPEVREWLASTFTRQLNTTRKKSDEKPKFRSVAHAIRAGIFVDRIYRRVSSTALMQFPPEVVKVLKTLDDWSFDVFALADAGNGQPVKYLGYDLLNRYGMIHKFKVPPATLEIFLNKIEEGYCRYRNPYHNNLHAADVAQTVHHVLCQTGLMHWLSDLEIFATLLAALIHDYEHTGTTNNFHVMSGSETAMLYNDRAVLENHHVSAAFKVLKEDESNVLQNLSREEFRELRTLIIDMVLATDMSYHFQQLKNMRNLLTLAEPVVDKSKALSLVLHCCDISHPAKKWNLHHRWTMLLLEEFFRQGDLERELGLPFSPLCDRNNTLVAESQIGFIEFIVEPSMTVCSDMLEIILAPIAPIACKTAESDETPNVTSKNPEAITEEGSEVNNKNGSSDEKSNRFRIRKPWVTCLAENKKIWKEQAVRDAEARAVAEAEKNQQQEIESSKQETTDQ